MTKTKIVGALLATTMLFSMAACGKDTSRVECDLDDQVELDSDCGYFADGHFNWYSWVVLGVDSYSPEGWHKPSYANHDQDKRKKIKKPKVTKSPAKH